MIVAIGGGNVIDAGRAAADQVNLPLVSVSTAASSGTACSAVSEIYDDDGPMLRADRVRSVNTPFLTQPHRKQFKLHSYTQWAS